MLKMGRAWATLGQRCLLASSAPSSLRPRDLRRSLHTSGAVAAGHAHWQNVARTKMGKDQAKGMRAQAIVKKIAKAIKTGGSFDPEVNNDLARVVKEAQDANVSGETVKRTIKRLQERTVEKTYVNVKGPNGTFFIVEFFTFDKAAKSERLVQRHIKKIAPNMFQLANMSIMDFFEEKGIILTAQAYKATEEVEKASQDDFVDETVERLGAAISVEEMQEIAIEVGAEEAEEAEDDEGRPSFELITDVFDHPKVEAALRDRNVHIRESDAGYVATYRVKISDKESEVVGQFYQALIAEEDVTKIFTNVDFAE